MAAFCPVVKEPSAVNRTVKSSNLLCRPKFMQPRKWAIALCQKGGLGLITSSEPVLLTFAKLEGGTEERLCWTGIYLSDHIRKPGQYWCSSNPQVLGYLDDQPVFKDLPYLK